MPEEALTQHRPKSSEAVISWETPDFTVVDTALEVTAYSLRAE